MLAVIIGLPFLLFSKPNGCQGPAKFFFLFLFYLSSMYTNTSFCTIYFFIFLPAIMQHFFVFGAVEFWKKAEETAWWLDKHLIWRKSARLITFTLPLFLLFILWLYTFHRPNFVFIFSSDFVHQVSLRIFVVGYFYSKHNIRCLFSVFTPC